MITRVAKASPSDAVLRQAIANHQAGHLAEAEKLYRQVLAFRPQFAEVHVNLAAVLMLQGKLVEGEAASRQGIAFKPDYAQAHYRLGDILAFQGRLDEAARSYRQALALKRDYAEAHNNLGNVLLQQGMVEDAEAAYRRAIAARPGFAEAYNNLGNLFMQQSLPDEAIVSYRRALEIRPDFSEAHNNIGYILLQTEKLDEAVLSFRRALTTKPEYAEALSNLGAALGKQDKLVEAEAFCLRAIAARPNYAEAHNNLGNVLKMQGKLVEAEASYRKAIAVKPNYAEAYKQLGCVLCEENRIEEGFLALTHHAELCYGPGKPLRAGPVVPHKIQHDREQYAYLSGTEASEGEIILESLRLVDGSRVTGPAVNLKNTIVEIEDKWRHKRPQIVVIDNLLTDEALGKLRRFCWGSTIWRMIYEGGYLGATPEHGFACPLLAQIAEELRTTYPAIFGGHPLLHSWAFKYDSRLSGIKLHADFAAVNVNFWITPDEANLDPQSGGLVVWDAAAPLDWDFMKYNTAEKEIRDFLAREGATPVTIPYRANRAVIFDSDLFHETDKIAFKEGYLNRRINVTLLYGSRERDGNAARIAD
jgi:tetratricopeptide (TPR) repeat protein